MANKDLVQYIKIQLEAGANEIDIKNALIGHGWNSNDVNNAFNYVENEFPKDGNFDKINKLEEPGNSEDSLLPNNEDILVEDNSKENSNVFTGESQAESPKNILKPYLSEGKNINGDDNLYSFINNQSNAEPVKTKRPNSILGIIISIILALIIITGIGFLYYYYFTPAGVADRVIKNFTSVKTFEISGGITMSSSSGSTLNAYKSKINADSPNSQTTELNLNGIYDLNDLNNIKSSTIFTTTASTSGNQVYNLGLETRSVNNVSYFRINSNSILGIFDLSKEKGQWIRYSAKEIENKLSSGELTAENDNSNGVITSENADKIVDEIRKSKAFKYVSMTSEDVNGISSNKINFSIDKKEAVNLYTAIAQFMSNKIYTDKEISDMSQGLDNFSFSNGTIWVGKKDSLPHKLSLAINYDSSKENIISNVEFNFEKYNETTNITAPVDSISLDVFLNSVLSGTNPAPTDTKSTLIKTQ